MWKFPRSSQSFKNELLPSVTSLYFEKFPSGSMTGTWQCCTALKLKFFFAAFFRKQGHRCFINNCSQKFWKTPRKTHVLESLSSKVASVGRTVALLTFTKDIFKGNLFHFCAILCEICLSLAIKSQQMLPL